MFHLAGRVALGVNIRNFFELERALKGNGIVNAAAEKEKILSALEALG